MTRINLLPWRDQLREQRKRRFLTIMVGFVCAAGALVLAVDGYLQRQIARQTGRNEFIRAEITVLAAQVAEINQLRQQQADIRRRMQVITDLQGTRPVIVRVFDELVRTLPDGVVYQSIRRTGDRIAIAGIAQAYSGITELMRNLDNSRWFETTDLSEFSVIGNGQGAGTAAIAFSLMLHIQLHNPSTASEA